MDWAAEGLLDGLEGDARDARVRLLDELHDDGVTIEELRAAVAGGPAGAAADRARADGARAVHAGRARRARRAAAEQPSAGCARWA